MSIEIAIKAIEEVLEKYGYVFFPFSQKKVLRKDFGIKKLTTLC
jgi:hypothetical protein